MNQGTVRRFDCLEDDSRKSSSWRPSGGSKPVLTKTLIAMGFGEMGLFGSSILAFWGWHWG